MRSLRDAPTLELWWEYLAINGGRGGRIGRHSSAGFEQLTVAAPSHSPKEDELILHVELAVTVQTALTQCTAQLYQ
jgi:hypothetical protein